MSDQRIAPDWILKRMRAALVDACQASRESTGGIIRLSTDDEVRLLAEEFIHCLRESPIEPTQTQSRQLLRDIPQGLLVDEIPQWFATEWQRRMFLKPEKTSVKVKRHE